MRENSNHDVGYRTLRWFPEFLSLLGQPVRAQARVLCLSVLVGLVAGAGAIVFFVATKTAEHFALGAAVGYRPEQPPAGEAQLSQLKEFDSPFRPWLLLVVPTLGGLMSGWLVFTVAPEAEGHGTDSVIAAYHQKQGEIRTRVPLIKIVASSLTIGSGGSGGREGPIAQIGAGFGSLLARLLHLRPVERRILVAAGMGAGVAAIFRAPLAGALFAAEVLYSSPEFEPEVIMPAAIASVVAYCTFGLFAGWQPLFATPDLTFTNPLELVPYTLLVVLLVALAMLYTRTFYAIQRLFNRLALPRQLKPAIGACLTGLIGLLLYLAFGTQQVLSVLSFGYGAIQQALAAEGTITAGVLFAIAVGKIVTTGLTIGSGGSGGVFGPSMVIGGCGGGALGVLLHQLAPSLVPHPASFVVVGMAGFFSAAAKTPFSTIVIVSEMTGGYHLLLPSLWVCSLAFMLSDRQSIYSSQVQQPVAFSRAPRELRAGRTGGCPRRSIRQVGPRCGFLAAQRSAGNRPQPLCDCQLSRSTGGRRDESTAGRSQSRRTASGHAILARRGSHSRRRHDAQRHQAIAAGRSSGSSLGAIRGKRSFGSTDRQRFERTTNHRHGATL